MKNLQLHCPQLVTDDVISRLFTPLACAVTLLAKSVPDWFAADVQSGNKSITDEMMENPNVHVCVCVCLFVPPPPGCLLSSGPTVLLFRAFGWFTG